MKKNQIRFELQVVQSDCSSLFQNKEKKIKRTSKWKIKNEHCRGTLLCVAKRKRRLVQARKKLSDVYGEKDLKLV